MELNTALCLGTKVKKWEYKIVNVASGNRPTNLSRLQLHRCVPLIIVMLIILLVITIDADRPLLVGELEQGLGRVVRGRRGAPGGGGAQPLTDEAVRRHQHGEQRARRDAVAQAHAAQRHVQRVRGGARPRLHAHAHAAELQLQPLALAVLPVAADPARTARTARLAGAVRRPIKSHHVYLSRTDDEVICKRKPVKYKSNLSTESFVLCYSRHQINLL